jgi:hypothetical protein
MLMKRRDFLAASLAAPALAVSGPRPSAQATTEGKSREFYQLRRYYLSSPSQRKLSDEFFRNALIPALNRLGISPVGVFNLTIGPQTPSMYVLMPGPSLEAVAMVEAHLGQDAQYIRLAGAFLNAPANDPAYARVESSLLQAFEKMPKLMLPAATATHAQRVFELRTYESPSDQDHRRKVEMMQSGEQEIFDQAGFWQIFYGDTLIGSRLPNLTYMLGYESLGERDKKWAAFGASPAWKSLSGQPRYAFENIVSNITNLILTPTEYSQI